MENKTFPLSPAVAETTVLTSQIFLNHWQSHRGLTRRVIEAFPEDKLFTYSIGGMRPFAQLAIEMLTMAGPGVRGLALGKWDSYDDVQKKLQGATTKAALLKLWDESTDEINEYWPQITAERFQEIEKVFGQWEGPVYWAAMYFMDNEIHHRGQGYVYLRGLGIEPPPFWDRH
ncbi:DinB family protein [Parachryseolinea silvisoli]|jgi:uncharacterized damage-inducible protein DinB|uniref:DinB family protein n=1 Tax=Parachryseolinea silvisoli TaxID=2873601 RepID=UPI0022658AF2|nr:DinB family protein [Parachryseolinea silvisoli]MCD9018702.1 DinB family protein [Parachryseolinea silvisoli]